MPEALAAVRAALGPDAIILSSTVAANGCVDVSAAVEHEALPRKPDQTSHTHGPSSQRSHTQRPMETSASFTGIANELSAVLQWAGARAQDADRWLQLPFRSADRNLQQELASAAEAEFAFAPIPTIPDTSLGLVGLAGGGRTSIAAKLAARALQAGGDPIIVSNDLLRAGGAAALEALACRLGCGFAEVENAQELRQSATKARESARFCVVDMESVANLNVDAVENSVGIAKQAGLEPILVLAGDCHPEDAADVAAAFAAAGVRRALITRIDLTKRRAGIFFAIARAGLKFTQISESPFIGSGLGPASAARIARLILDPIPHDLIGSHPRAGRSNAA
jgi:flagellar biosynthesis protein FlhF